MALLCNSDAKMPKKYADLGDLVLQLSILFIGYRIPVEAKHPLLSKESVEDLTPWTVLEELEFIFGEPQQYTLGEGGVE